MSFVFPMDFWTNITFILCFFFFSHIYLCIVSCYYHQYGTEFSFLSSLLHSFQVDLRHIDELNGTNVVEVGVDLSEFYTSVEWDILEVPAVR